MVDASSARRGDFKPNPAFWDRLPSDDKSEFLRLRAQLHSDQQNSSKDSRVVTFRRELVIVLQFIERSGAFREERSILAGIAFGGPFICVNTRTLKAFLGRCKSSINGGFQQMGYVALKNKTKARACIITVMQPLGSDANQLRQWTVRGASPSAESCFLSSFPARLLPDLHLDDLNLDPAEKSVCQLWPKVQTAAAPVQVAQADRQWDAPRPQEQAETRAEPLWQGNQFGVDSDWVRMTNEWSAL